MKVVITAGGKGERLRPLTNNIPKPMVVVQGKPLLEHVVDYLNKQGFDDFILTLCYKGEIIKNYFGDGSKLGVKINYTYEDVANPLGTAGGVGLARDQLKETFAVICGDALRSLNFAPVLKAHKEKGAFATITLHRPKNEKVTSLVRFDKDNKLLGFVERPTSEQLSQEKNLYTNSSFYILTPEIFKYIPKNQKVDFGYDVWPKVLEKCEKVYVYPSDDYVLDVGIPEKLEEAQRLKL